MIKVGTAWQCARGRAGSVCRSTRQISSGVSSTLRYRHSPVPDRARARARACCLSTWPIDTRSLMPALSLGSASLPPRALAPARPTMLMAPAIGESSLPRVGPPTPRPPGALPKPSIVRARTSEAAVASNRVSPSENPPAETFFSPGDSPPITLRRGGTCRPGAPAVDLLAEPPIPILIIPTIGPTTNDSPLPPLDESPVPSLPPRPCILADQAPGDAAPSSGTDASGPDLSVDTPAAPPGEVAAV